MDTLKYTHDIPNTKNAKLALSLLLQYNSEAKTVWNKDIWEINVDPEVVGVADTEYLETIGVFPDEEYRNFYTFQYRY